MNMKFLTIINSNYSWYLYLWCKIARLNKGLGTCLNPKGKKDFYEGEMVVGVTNFLDFFQD
jgi:hypothetical protein